MTDRRYQAIDLAIKAGKLELADAIYSWLETGRWHDEAPATVRFAGSVTDGKVLVAYQALPWGHAWPEYLVNADGDRISFVVDRDGGWPYARVDEGVTGPLWGVYLRKVRYDPVTVEDIASDAAAS